MCEFFCCCDFSEVKTQLVCSDLGTVDKKSVKLSLLEKSQML